MRNLNQRHRLLVGEQIRHGWLERFVASSFKEHFLGCDKFILPGRNFSRSFEPPLVELPMLPDLGSSLQLA